MTVLDIVIIVVFLASAIYGLKKGIVVQVGAIAGVVFGIIACRVFGDPVAEYLKTILPLEGASPELAHYVVSVIAYVTLFVFGYVLIRIIASMIKKVAHAAFMGTIDRILGALFSIFQWMLIMSLVLNVWQMFLHSRTVVSYSTLGGGRVAQAIMDLAPLLFGFTEFS